MFWVVFDTCTRPQYYEDVHNLLALPSGATIRYDYRQKYLSADAIVLSSGRQVVPVLLVYAQKNAPYSREGTSLQVPDGDLDVLWVATRVGRMLNVVKDADKYYFDFQVASYPNQNAGALDSILGPLRATGEVPWTKWVCTSTQDLSLRTLEGGDAQTNWAAIVNALGTYPMQFSNDAFWRLVGPFKGSQGRLRYPKLESLTESGRIRQRRSRYVMIENNTWRCEIVSDAPRSGTGGSARPRYVVEASTTDDKAIKIIGNPTYELRTYTARTLEYRAQPVPVFAQRSADLTLSTSPKPTDWPTGPRIELRHVVRKSYLRVAVGILIGTAGMITGGLGVSRLFENDTLHGAVLAVGGALLLVAARFILSGKWEFKS